jgi:excisionase family DNA binding protein
MSTTRQPLTPNELCGRIVITVPEYAATFGYDERTVRRAVRDGQIQALQIGDTWRIPTAPLLRQLGITPENSEGEPGSSPIASTATLQTIGPSHDKPAA